MSTETKVFIDLEDTVITVFNDPVLINRSVVSRWLDVLAVNKVQIFSFAIWDEKDKVTFEQHMKTRLEQALSVEITEWLSVDEMATISTKHTGIQWERLDFMQLRGKHGAFFDVCKAREADCTCILLDDAVPHETLQVHHRNLTLNLQPVQMLNGFTWRNWA